MVNKPEKFSNIPFIIKNINALTYLEWLKSSLLLNFFSSLSNSPIYLGLVPQVLPKEFETAYQQYKHKYTAIQIT
jgi:hypothetical protein